MFKKIERELRRAFKGKRHSPPLRLPPPPPPPPPPPQTPESQPPEPSQKPSEPTPFLFPSTQSTVLPDPSVFFSPELLSAPLPSNSFFQNFTLNNGDQPEYIHPYLIKSSLSSISVSYPSILSTCASECQIFTPDLTISPSEKINPLPQKSHVISSFNDLSVTLDIPSSNLRFYLVRGSPFLTFTVSKGVAFSISTIHEVISFSFNNALTKYTIKLKNNQTWLIYSSFPINLTHNLSMITSGGFAGIIRIAALPNSDLECERILDRFSSCYPVLGEAQFTKPFCLEYKWETKGWGDLLMLAHPLHLRLLRGSDDNVIILDKFKYKSIDGELVGVVGSSWALKPEPISVSWHSIRGVEEESFAEIISALRKDVEALNSTSMILTTKSPYSYGKLIARAARLAVIAEEVRSLEVVPEIRKFLIGAIEPWLNGTFEGNGFLYDEKWGGIVTKEGAFDHSADFGFGIYNNHHHHLGYFLYAIAVLVKIDPAWGRKYSPQVYSLMADIMNLSRRANSKFPKLRCFDPYKLHSWGTGLAEFTDGRSQESVSEAVNAYYSAALVGLAYGDAHLVSIGSMLAALEIKAGQMWWQIREGETTLYKEEFVKENRVVGVLWSNKRDSGLWFAPSEWKECRLGIQVLPILPITELLLSDVGFVRELVNWALPSLGREGVGEGWKGFVHALESIYDKDGSLQKIRNLKEFDDGNSLTNLLWWVHSRGKEEENISNSKIHLV
ncbi:hypothetical protein IC582_020625 [Cucumis melo]|uniref:glucan endo-1,3-beta-D-glucosidase n=2 Tax=Cucumis melo TaxID=3656 RepID=A0A1S3CBD8_CUCME|nr:ascus wall endo-1,3(4)-beta-glucanase-like [Cucumis melo]ADN34285.1 beta-glucan-binding protein [Cucumis melo subsp. melo]